MFGDFAKVAFMFGGPLLLGAVCSKGLIAVGLGLLALMVVASAYGSAKGFAEADSNR